MAIKKAHTEKGEDRDRYVGVGVITSSEIEANGVDSMNTVSDDTDGAAGCKHLNNGIVPTGWEECAEGING